MHEAVERNAASYRNSRLTGETYASKRSSVYAPRSSQETRVLARSLDQQFEQELTLVRSLLEASIEDGRYTPPVLEPVSLVGASEKPALRNKGTLTLVPPEEAATLGAQIEEMRSYMRRFAVSRGVKDITDLDEVISMAMTKAAHYMQTGKLTGEYLKTHSLQTFMLNLVRYSWLALLRERRERKEIFISEILESQEDGSLRHGGDIAKFGSGEKGFSTVEDNEAASRLMDLIEIVLMRSTSGVRRVMMLKIFFGMSNSDIARVIDRSRQRVSNLVDSFRRDFERTMNSQGESIVPKVKPKLPSRPKRIKEAVSPRSNVMSAQEKYDSLSPREKQVLTLLADITVKGNSGIAEVLGIDIETVKSYVINIFRKLGVNDRTKAAVFEVKRTMRGLS